MLRRLYEGQVAAGELRSMFEDLSFDTMTRMVFGKRYHGRDPNVTFEESRVFRMAREALELHGKLCLGDYFPIFRRVDVQGVERRINGGFHEEDGSDKFMQGVVDERRELMAEESSQMKTLIDVVLSRRETEPELHSD